MGADGSGNCAFDSEYAVSRHGNVANGIAQTSNAGLPAIRRAACCAADHVAAGKVLRRTGEDAAGAEHEALGLERAETHLQNCRQTFNEWTDEFCEDALEIFERLQRGAAGARPPAAREVSDFIAGTSGNEADQSEHAVRSSSGSGAHGNFGAARSGRGRLNSSRFAPKFAEIK